MLPLKAPKGDGFYMVAECGTINRYFSMKIEPELIVKTMQLRSTTIKKITKEFRKEIEKLYSRRLKQVILYGSWARGDATTESDIDLLVMLEGDVIPGQEIDRMIDIITDINLKYDVLISVYPLSEAS